jgi:cadmium resistance protein CadD (predicted permease)
MGMEFKLRSMGLKNPFKKHTHFVLLTECSDSVSVWIPLFTFCSEVQVLLHCSSILLLSQFLVVVVVWRLESGAWTS